MSNYELPRATGSRRFGNGAPKVVCVGLNYSDHTGESKMEPPKAPLLFGKFANTLCGDGDAIVLPDGVGHVDARGRAGARDRPHREPRRRRTTRSSSSTAGRARTTSRRATTSSATASGSAARASTRSARSARASCRATSSTWADLRIQQRLNGETLQDSRTSKLIFDIPTLVSYVTRGDHARARRPDPDRHARGRRLLPRAEGRAAPTATSSRSRSRGSACCGTTSARRERRRCRGGTRRSMPCGRIVTLLTHFRRRHVTISRLGSIA